jgi:hypothetical protein
MRKKVFLFAVGLIAKLIYLPLHCSSQLMTNSNIGITITGGVQVTVKGDILNQNGTAIDNSGTIDFTGNWRNNSGSTCFGTSTGTVILNGANQDIGGSNSTVFNNLAVEGGGIKTLLINTTTGGANATPAGALTLTSGVLNLNSNTLFISNQNSTAISYTSGSIYSEQVDNSSKVDWNMQSATGVHTIPFSNSAGTIIPFTFNLASGNAGHVVTSTYAANTLNVPYPSAPNPVSSIATLGNGNPSYMVHRYWQVDVDNTAAVSDLTFTWDASTEMPAASGTKYAQPWDNASAWTNPSPNQSNPTTNSTLLLTNQTYGTYGIAIGASPLPMTLIRFTAKLNSNKQVDVNWTTASEINNDYFSVQRSANGIDFETIAEVDGAGNSTGILHYYSLDKNPLHGISYYRLLQTDFDGKQSMSQIVPINNSSSFNADVIVYPNPVTDFALIAFNPSVENTGQVVFELYDVLGKQVLHTKLSGLNGLGENVFRWKRNVIAGTYFYRLVNATEKILEGKLIVN